MRVSEASKTAPDYKAMVSGVGWLTREFAPYSLNLQKSIAGRYEERATRGETTHAENRHRVYATWVRPVSQRERVSFSEGNCIHR